jgi:pimeloyl-ACP methyl ester carboxylesterase
MPYFTTQDGTEIFYKDWGSGQPIVFHHGWPQQTCTYAYEKYPHQTSCSPDVGGGDV